MHASLLCWNCEASDGFNKRSRFHSIQFEFWFSLLEGDMANVDVMLNILVVFFSFVWVLKYRHSKSACFTSEFELWIGCMHYYLTQNLSSIRFWSIQFRSPQLGIFHIINQLTNFHRGYGIRTLWFTELWVTYLVWKCVPYGSPRPL